ncbi:MarR family winged helix-turn-helix transcriptional regulator [Haloferax sulfurifontis]|uniref:MarR family transcriptional regulator n=1 Tax=Haloferax sulfurifontis ATCC BAA-897 TaxID=662480 RepID=M0I336_9EURY|nr:MarR family winged helix-turn-helix transcriptional regulator [Haloferax sulfurifontis]ELZ91151.1 MarR family transcriptional regulator [Haloferax sulfurifontis ATCC BAA-897]
MGNLDLPENSIFASEDYEKMQEVSSTSLATDILEILEENDRLSQNELVETLNRDADDIHDTLKDMMRVALIKQRRDPNTDRKGTYSYYTLTKPGRTVLREGIDDGVRALIRAEHDAEQKYSK